MELLEQVQHDLGEGPYLQADAQDQAVVVEDLRVAPTWARIDAVVGQLHVRGVLSVPIRLAGQPVGTPDVYSTQPRAWTAHELEAMGELATVAGELVHTSVELASRELEVARLQQALTNRVWIEQAKGVLAATQGTDPQAACQQLRARARASSRELAELAREVVQGAQRQRLGALALDDVRVREAEARAQAAEQALQAAQADLVQRRDGMVARRPASGGRAGEEQAMGGNQAVSAGPPPEGIAVGEDGVARCWWGAGDPLYRRYHDQEWGRPVAEDRRLFEKLSLEGFQAGLSWLTILRKRERFREVFAGFDPVVVARFGVREVDRLLADPGIVRNRAKIEATINNAGRYGELAAEFGSLAAYVWRFEPGSQARPPVLDHASLLQLGQSSESKAMSKDLRRRGWSFVGPTTVYAFMEAMGLVNDHLEGCGCRPAVERERHRFRRPKVAAGGTRSRSRPPS